MKSSLTLIGMPGAGKSTVGIILAKRLSYGFVDTDILIQTRCKKSLQQIIDASGHLELRRIEELEIMSLDLSHHVIATGGSAVYSEKAMAHLRSISTILFLKVSYAEIVRRIRNFSTRGIAKSVQQTFAELYDERQVLYETYADETINCSGLGQDEIAEALAALYL
ncbi:MAG: shikimate kinase [Desulfuromonadales bacterium]